MKNDNLERQFNEYFNGVNLPDDITADAKNHVKKPFRFNGFLKFASVAASIVLVCVISVAVMTSGILGTPQTPESFITTYDVGNLTCVAADGYGISKLNSSLKIIQNFALADNATVNDCKTYYSDENLTLAYADVSILKGITRQDAKIYIEFTPENEVYEPLKDFTEGTKRYYYNNYYRYNFEYAENGEPVTYIYLYLNEVKYYFEVNSSDSNAYFDYLNMILK